MSDTDLSWTGKPPRITNPEEAAAAERILRERPGEPKGHEKLDELRPAHSEELSPAPSRLDPELRWFFPALAYSMMGMDRSLFELFSWAAQAAVRVSSHRADQPIADFAGADVSANPWFYTVQGIGREQADEFISYVETYRFDDPNRRLNWQLSFQELRVADPFVADSRVGTYLTFLLPECLTSGRRTSVVRPAGLLLDRPLLGIRTEPEAE